jgi:hypothetical protein
MPPPYHPYHWNTFINIPYQPQGAVGQAPAAWALQHGLADIPAGLPDHLLTRQEVRAICQNHNNPVLFGYICAMAWGGQRHFHAGPAWANRQDIALALENLRNGDLPRNQAYGLFNNGHGNHFPGLGPAYFTKLLYFFSPEPCCYIMDQWTAKSVNILNQKHVVRMNGGNVHNMNSGNNYQAFCEEIDDIAEELCHYTGDIAEERLFSKGGHHPWPWRAYLMEQWGGFLLPLYNEAVLADIYPHIWGQ